MTLNCTQIFIVTGSFLYGCVMWPASQRFFIHSCIYLWILILYYLATFLGTIAFLCVCAVKQSINQSVTHGNLVRPNRPTINRRWIVISILTPIYATSMLRGSFIPDPSLEGPATFTGRGLQNLIFPEVSLTFQKISMFSRTCKHSDVCKPIASKAPCLPPITATSVQTGLGYVSPHVSIWSRCP